MSDTNLPGNQPPQQPLAPPPAPPAPPAAQQQVGYPGVPQQPPMNALAIVAFVASFFVSLVGIICGHIALAQIKRTGERGRGFALAGTIIGYVALAGTILVIVFSVVIAGIAVQAANSSLGQLKEITEEYESPTPDAIGPTEDAPETDEPGAEPSGDRSVEFCAALDAVAASGGDVSSGEIDPSVLESFRRLAEVESPNQEVYQRFYEVVQDPLADTDTETLLSDYFDAAMEDSMACL